MKPARALLPLAAILALSAGPAPSPTLTGFTPKRSAWQREYERRLLDGSPMSSHIAHTTILQLSICASISSTFGA